MVPSLQVRPRQSAPTRCQAAPQAAQPSTAGNSRVGEVKAVLFDMVSVPFHWATAYVSPATTLPPRLPQLPPCTALLFE